MLARIRTILGRTVEAGGSTEEIIDHFRGRLDALSRHELARALNPEGSVDLEELVRDELHEFWLGNDPRISISGVDVSLSHDIACSFRLAIHELTTNATKFGALSPDLEKAKLRICWSVHDCELCFHWHESGIVQLTSTPAKEGFGRELLERALPYELGADVVLDQRPGALSWHIRFPLGATLSNDAVVVSC